MNHAVIIYEDDDFLYGLLRFRLALYLPDCYIMRDGDKNYLNNINQFSDTLFVLFDDHQYDEYDVVFENIEGINVFYLPLYSETDNGPLIDCKELAIRIAETKTTVRHKSQNIEINDKPNRNGVHILIPFSYIDERERFIDEELSFLRDSDNMCIRLDLMAGIRMPINYSGSYSTVGSLTQLLDKAKSRNISPEDILAFVNPDSNGFFTPGKPQRSDDVFDYGTDTLATLINTLSTLVNEESDRFTGLIVAEGFRFRELINLASCCDVIHILLPKRMYETDLGFKTEIAELTKNIPTDCKVTVYDSDKYQTERKLETIKI